MIAGSLGQCVDYLIIGLACWKVGGVFSKNSRLTAGLGERIAVRRVRELAQQSLHNRQSTFTRHHVAIESDRGYQETVYDFYARPREPRVGPTATAPRALMVYHHGMGELPHDYTFHNLFFGADPIVGVDLIAMKATYHPPHLIPTPDAAYLADAACWIEMMADSVALVGYLADRHRSRYEGLFLGGISLGGIITLATLTYLDRFDLYHPMMAGPNLPEHLRQSLFIHFTSAEAAAALDRDPDLESLNFVGAVAHNLNRVQILAAEFDPVFRVGLLRQLAQELPGLRLEVMPYAHITGCLAAEELRQRLFRRWREWAAMRTSNEARPNSDCTVSRAALQSQGCRPETPA